MNILFCASEMAPLVKVGGLGDVVGSLPQALARRGHDVRVVIPLYGALDRALHNIEPAEIAYSVNVRGREEPAAIWTTRVADKVQVYLIEHAYHFGGQAVYTSSDLDRFHYFSRAALELLRHLDWRADVLHCHDWHTGAAISVLRNELRYDAAYRDMASVFTIHNLGYQGWFEYDWALTAGVAFHVPPKDNPLHPLLWRMMGLGIYHADAVSTVSETYAKEILTPEMGEGLDPVLRHRQGQLLGIVNGIDYDEFNPAADPHIPLSYDIASASRKAGIKQRLRDEVGLPQDSDAPLLGYVGRLARQKGMPALVEGMKRILPRHRAQLLVLGQAPRGEEVYESMLRALEAEYPQQVKVIARFDDPLSRRIYAGCDIFLMPSLYEPCGLGQLIALRYGAVPLVRHTGGLADTVVEHPVTGNGFVFHGRNDGADLADVLERALYLFMHKERWSRLVARAMSSESSWERASERYEELYQKAIELHLRG